MREAVETSKSLARGQGFECTFNIEQAHLACTCMPSWLPHYTGRGRVVLIVVQSFTSGNKALIMPGNAFVCLLPDSTRQNPDEPGLMSFQVWLIHTSSNPKLYAACLQFGHSAFICDCTPSKNP